MPLLRRFILVFVLTGAAIPCFCWGFYAHRKINQQAVFLLPPEMMQLYKPNIIFITDHAVDPDKRRYAIPEEAPRHYIDIDHYGKYPYDSLPRKWEDAVKKYSADTLNLYGIAHRLARLGVQLRPVMQRIKQPDHDEGGQHRRRRHRHAILEHPPPGRAQRLLAPRPQRQRDYGRDQHEQQKGN